MPSIVFPAWPERVITDEAAAAAVAKDMDRRSAKRAFLLMSGTLSRDVELMSQLRAALGDRLTGVYASLPQHSPLPAVLDAARKAKAAETDILVSIGGGSIIDATKLVQLCLAHAVFDEGVLRLSHSSSAKTGGTPQSGPIAHVPHICVPTTISGAEFTFFGGVRNPATGLKAAFVDAHLMPRTLILDPSLTTRTPAQLWLSSGVRAMDHAIEGLCSPRSHAFSDALALKGLAQLKESLAAAKAAPGDLAARKRNQLGAWFASMPLISGVAMGASHAIGHALGSFCDVPHGLTSCVILPAVMQFNFEAIRERFDPIAAALGAGTGRDAPDQLRRFISGLGLPGTLRDLGLGREVIPDVARGALQESWLASNPRPIREARDVATILEMAA
jgi:maleylacetate reductase